MSDEMFGLTYAQATVLRELLAGSSISKAARAAGVSRKSASTWVNHDETFIEARRKLTSEPLAVAKDRLVRLARDAADALEEVLNNPDTPSAVRVNAAGLVLKACGLGNDGVSVNVNAEATATATAAARADAAGVPLDYARDFPHATVDELQAIRAAIVEHVKRKQAARAAEYKAENSAFYGTGVSADDQREEVIAELEAPQGATADEADPTPIPVDRERLELRESWPELLRSSTGNDLPPPEQCQSEHPVIREALGNHDRERARKEGRGSMPLY